MAARGGSATAYYLSRDPQGTLVQRHLHTQDTPNDVWVYRATGGFAAWAGGPEVFDSSGLWAFYRGSGYLTFEGDLDAAWHGTWDPVAYLGQLGVREGDNNLVLMDRRYYFPFQGRFATRDPIGYDGGLNLYTYCHGDPVNTADPSGLHVRVAADGSRRGESASRYGARWARARYHRLWRWGTN